MQPPRAIDTILRAAGRTPLVRLSQLERAGGPRLYAKCEFLGPGNAIFDRAAVATVVGALRSGHLASGRGIVIAGGTDASISMALCASATGHPITVVAPDTLHPERRRILTDYGATLELVDASLGLDAAGDVAFELAGRQRALYVDPFRGREVIEAYEEIGRELFEALGGAPALTVCGLDLGAIPTGVSRGLCGAPVVAVEPAAARIASAGTFGPHLCLGLAPGPDPVALDRACVQGFEHVDDREAWETAERLSRDCGVLAGLASGAVLTAALRRSASLGPEASVVAVLPDSGERRFMCAAFFA